MWVYKYHPGNFHHDIKAPQNQEQGKISYAENWVTQKTDGEIHSFHNFEFIHNFELQIIQTIANICVVTADDQTWLSR